MEQKILSPWSTALTGVVLGTEYEVPAFADQF
jgi:hypothetical protein